MRKTPLKSARRRALWKCGQRKRVAHSPTGEQNQKKRTNHLLPKPDNLIRYRQNGANSVGEADTFGEQFSPFTDAPPSILIGFVWNRRHRTHPGLAAQPSEQSAQKQLGIDAIRLRSAHAPIHRYARRLDDVDLDALRREPPRQPEP